MPVDEEFLAGLKDPITNMSFELHHNGALDMLSRYTYGEEGKTTIVASNYAKEATVPSSISASYRGSIPLKSESYAASADTVAKTIKSVLFKYTDSANTEATFQQCEVIVHAKIPVAAQEQSESSSPIRVFLICKAFDPRIDIARFVFQFQHASQGLKAYAYTPRFQLHSVGSGNYDADLAFLTKLFDQKPENKVKDLYGDGKGKNAADTKVRFDELALRWHNGNPYSAMMAYDGKTPVAMVTMGSSGRAGVAELAIISIDADSNPDVGWNKGVAKELGMLLFVAPTQYRQAGYKLDGADLQAIMATARPDNGSARTLDALGIPERDLLPGEERNRYGAKRRFFEVTLKELEAVVNNTANKIKIGL